MHASDPGTSTTANRLGRVIAIGTVLWAWSAFSMSGRASPPSYPDEQHVLRGCHISTTIYLTRFRTNFPNEQAHALHLTTQGSGRRRTGHSVAVVSWQGKWWLRDEYLGVFSLDRPSDGDGDLADLKRWTQETVARLTIGRTGFRGSSRANPPPTPLSAQRRLHEIAVAQRLLPIPSTVCWVRSGETEFPLLLFRPAEGWIAVYDPAHGTCAADTRVRHDLGFVAIAAQRFGYRVDAVRDAGRAVLIGVSSESCTGTSAGSELPLPRARSTVRRISRALTANRQLAR